MRLHPHNTWRPLLKGQAGASALEAVEAIAEVAQPAIETWSGAHPDPAGANAHSLAWGRAGVALFYAYRAAAKLPGADLRAASELLERSIEQVGNTAPRASLFVGFSGVAWATEHLNALVRAGIEAQAPGPNAADADSSDADDPNAEIDELLASHLETPRPDAEWDLVEGLVGLGVYAHERLPRASARRCIGLIVQRLGELARPQPAGLAWATPPRRLAARAAAGETTGLDDLGAPTESRGGEEFDLGLAHGTPGVIALLGLAYAADIQPHLCTALLEGAVPWLLAQQLPDGEGSSFPGRAGVGIEPVPARCAWCYGDPGVAVALLGAARRLGRPAWEQAALRIARHAAADREQRYDVRDAQLCHGSAGVAHAFNRIHQATGDTSSLAAAEYWLGRTLQFRAPGTGLAGFQTWSLERTLDGEWIDDPRLLTGIAGIGLVLLAAATAVAPAWDRALLLSVPSAR